MKKILFLFLLMSNTLLFGQINVTGTVLDLKSKAVIGASVYIENTYDGDFTDEEGKFNFSTDETGKQVIVVSYISYKTKKISLDVNDMHNLTIKIKQEVNELNAVTITAGTFETGENSKTAVLDPIEVVTTAGAEAGDINSAIKTLPGIQTVGEDGRLFVRGGDASETKVFIDGMRVFKPYLTNNANMPTRSRFSSFLFKGVAFSLGGFSAEYGDALSGVLSMNTIDFPKQNQTDISLMSLGLGIGKTKILKNDAISLS
ncbi:MAG TPA: TonB-dependent receptor, partial [Saprospiraceae bacterium]|nr:TonB-dependent receptor [Saprospiraceae bacterium]